MKSITKLTLVKTIHTIIWAAFVATIFFIVYSGLVDKVSKWTWTAIGLIVFEGLVLLSFNWTCPLTIIARRYSDSAKENFDIYLPEWLAKHNKTIFTTLFLIATIVVIYRVLE